MKTQPMKLVGFHGISSVVVMDIPCIDSHLILTGDKNGKLVLLDGSSPIPQLKTLADKVQEAANKVNVLVEKVDHTYFTGTQKVDGAMHKDLLAQLCIAARNAYAEANGFRAKMVEFCDAITLIQKVAKTSSEEDVPGYDQGTDLGLTSNDDQGCDCDCGCCEDEGNEEGSPDEDGPLQGLIGMFDEVMASADKAAPAAEKPSEFVKIIRGISSAMKNATDRLEIELKARNLRKAEAEPKSENATEQEYLAGLHAYAKSIGATVIKLDEDKYDRDECLARLRASNATKPASVMKSSALTAALQSGISPRSFHDSLKTVLGAPKFTYPRDGALTLESVADTFFGEDKPVHTQNSDAEYLSEMAQEVLSCLNQIPKGSRVTKGPGISESLATSISKGLKASEEAIAANASAPSGTATQVYEDENVRIIAGNSIDGLQSYLESVGINPSDIVNPEALQQMLDTRNKLTPKKVA